jgi:radical SAM protein with 4Fe4S-binding SPASM domain
MTGGELTAHPDLLPFLRFVRTTRLPWSMATNARIFAVEANVGTFRKAGLVRAVVSLHGDQATHDWVTGTESFGQTVEGIRHLETAGVRVDVSVVVTPRLLEKVTPKSYAAMVTKLDVARVVVRTPQLEDGQRTPALVPSLGRLVRWVDDLGERLERRNVRVETSGIPRCAFSVDRGRAESPQALPPAPPCRTCRLLGECASFLPDDWQPGDVDFLLPRSLEAPGHLLYTRGRPLKEFDLASCPYRGGQRKPPCSHDGIILDEAPGSAVLWRLDPPGLAESVLLHAKIHHGQVWRARKDGTIDALLLADECTGCHRLHECPAVFRPAGTEMALPGTGPDAGPAIELDQATCDLTALLDAAFEGGTTVRSLVREVWLVDRGAQRPRRPFPQDPARLLRELRYNGVVPTAYRIPEPTRRLPFEADLVARDRCNDPFVTVHHEGASLQVTESCMCRCVMCNIVGYFKQPMMPLPRTLRAIEECGLLGMRLTDLFGGEVTLRKDLFELIRHVRWMGMECMFITTGYYVTPTFVKQLKEAGLGRVVVSIDGSRPEIHDAIRQLPGIYDRAVRAMKALAAEPEIETFASTVILAENLWDLPDLIRLSGRIGIRKHEFFLPISGPVSSTTPRWPTAQQMDSFFDEILPEMERAARKSGVSIDFRPELRTWEISRREARQMISEGLYNIHARNPDSRCHAPGYNLFITVNGNVYPCDMPSVIHRDQALGNLDDATLLEIITSDAMRTFAEGAGHYPACRMCVGRYEAVR